MKNRWEVGEIRYEAIAAAHGRAAYQGRSTTDFVHYVMHFAANRSGEACDVCAGIYPMRYA